MIVCLSIFFFILSFSFSFPGKSVSAALCVYFEGKRCALS